MQGIGDWGRAHSTAVGAGLLVAVVLAVAVAVALRLGGRGEQIASASASPVQTAEPPIAAESGSVSPSASADATQAVTATPSLWPGPSAAAPPAEGQSFVVTETFGEEGWNTQFMDVEFWNGRWIALSVRSQITTDEVEVDLWTSTDGSSWTRDPFRVSETWTVILADIIPLGGSAVAIVARLGAPAGGWTASAWRSTDLARWQETDLGLPADDPAAVVAVGPRGYVALGNVSGALWFSPDGLHWELVYEPPAGATFWDVRAGREGFVATGSSAQDSYFTAASGDGRSWFREDWASTLPIEVGPIGMGDWVAVAGKTDFKVLWSANGLDWQPRTTVSEISGFTSGFGILTQVTRVDLLSVGGEAFMSLGWDHCCAQLSGGRGLWRSANGATWTEVDLGGVDGAVVRASATDGMTVVLGGFGGRGAQGILWVSVRADTH